MERRGIALRNYQLEREPQPSSLSHPRCRGVNFKLKKVCHLIRGLQSNGAYLIISVYFDLIYSLLLRICLYSV